MLKHLAQHQVLTTGWKRQRVSDWLFQMNILGFGPRARKKNTLYIFPQQLLHTCISKIWNSWLWYTRLTGLAANSWILGSCVYSSLNFMKTKNKILYLIAVQSSEGCIAVAREVRKLNPLASVQWRQDWISIQQPITGKGLKWKWSDQTCLSLSKLYCHAQQRNSQSRVS